MSGEWYVKFLNGIFICHSILFIGILFSALPRQYCNNLIFYSFDKYDDAFQSLDSVGMLKCKERAALAALKQQKSIFSKILQVTKQLGEKYDAKVDVTDSKFMKYSRRVFNMQPLSPTEFLLSFLLIGACN